VPAKYLDYYGGGAYGGSMLLMWMGEMITEQGIGNGISLLITVGIVSRLPQSDFGDS